jgi:hypothetical protein
MAVFGFPKNIFLGGLKEAIFPGRPENHTPPEGAFCQGLPEG